MTSHITDLRQAFSALTLGCVGHLLLCLSPPVLVFLFATLAPPADTGDAQVPLPSSSSKVLFPEETWPLREVGRGKESGMPLVTGNL